MNQLSTSILFLLSLFLISCGFAEVGRSGHETPDFLNGIWHGLLAPWSLGLGLFLDLKMYAFPNSGWFYDFGFLIGIVGSIPIGWMAAIVATVFHFFII